MLKNSATLSLSAVLIFGLSINSVLAQNNPPVDKQVIEDQTSQQTAWLGVWIKNVPIALGKHLSPMLQKNQGVLVSKVHDNSPAQQADLQEYDVIAQLNDQKIFSAQQLSQLVHNTRVGSKMTIHYVHQGKMISKEVDITSKPQDAFSHHITPNKIHPLPFQGFDPFSDPGFNLPNFPNRSQLNSKQSSWSEFESLSIQSTGDNKYKVSVQYQDSNSDKKEFSFEGDMEQIQQQIESTDTMDKNKKMKLLDALANQDSSYSPFPPGVFQYPDWMNRHHMPFPHHYR